MSKSVNLLIFFITSVMCYSCSTLRSREPANKPEAIFVINDYGRLYEPICMNYFGLSNIDKITTGRDKKSKKGRIIIYMKDSVKLISFNTLLERNGLKKVGKRPEPVYLDTTLIAKPHKLVFVASQKFTIDSIYDGTGRNSTQAFLLRISPIN